MGEVIFCKTNDGSVGLFNKKVNDIYHSTYGAYSESYEKFILSSGFLNFIKDNDSVSILDICYGIGYNTKTALDEILKLDKIINVKIDALEYDKELVMISPFLSNQKINNEINNFIINNTNFCTKFSPIEIIKNLHQKKGLQYLSIRNLARFKAHKSSQVDKQSFLNILSAFYHNIYYNYIAFRNKKGQKTNKLAKTSLVFHFDDARVSIQKLDNKYNFIFLDAFTPKKLPTLWSLEFFKQLYRLLSDNGMLITYSSSATVRGAMLEAGFFIGRSLDANGKIIGTVATKQPHLIKHNLEDFERELIQTRAGIYYRDENLDSSPEEINARRDNEVQNSDRMTSSRLKKIYAKK